MKGMKIRLAVLLLSLGVIAPAAGKAYADRSLPTPYRLLRDDAAHRLFRSHGFQWGGAWRSLKDYQHFEMP